MSPSLSSYQLARMRATEGTTFDTTCAIQPQTYTPDGAGGGTVTWSGGVTVPCSLAVRDVRPQERAEPGAITFVQLWEAQLPWDTVVRPTDHLVELGTGQEFEVVGFSGPDSRPLTLSVQLTVVDS